MSSKRFQLNNCNLLPDCRHGNAHAITLLTVRAVVSYRTFSDAVGVTILKLNLTVQDLDQVELGFFIAKKKNKMNTVTAMQTYVSPSPFLESI